MNLVLRILSALVLLPIVVFLLHRGGDYTYGLILVVATMALFEYSGIVDRADRVARSLFMVSGVVAVGLSMRAQSAVLGLLIVQVPSILVMLLFVLRTGTFDSAWNRMTTLAFGLPYVGLGMVAIYRLRLEGNGLESVAAPTWVYVALLATWSNDTFAYFAGRAFGKHKMYPKVSPKKTWEGFAGGALGSVGMLFAMQAGFPQAFGHFTAVDFLFIGVPAAFLAPLGDLAESLLKRNFGVKDSGNTIPGHGGMLDRVDALLLVSPWVLLYATGIRPFLQS